MTSNSYDPKVANKILKLLGRFSRLDGGEIKDLTGSAPEEINDGIDYLENLGAVKIKGKNPPYDFLYVSISKDGVKLYNKKFLED